jgi:hypothetical protein
MKIRILLQKAANRRIGNGEHDLFALRLLAIYRNFLLFSYALLAWFASTALAAQLDAGHHQRARQRHQRLYGFNLDELSPAFLPRAFTVIRFTLTL